jgi:hypothetical protein
MTLYEYRELDGIWNILVTNGGRFCDNRSPSGCFTMMCRCVRGGSSENTSTKSSMDDSEVALVRSRLKRLCCK